MGRERETPGESDERVARFCSALVAKKALDVIVLDISALSSVADAFILASAYSRLAVQALADAVRETAREAGERPLRSEGQSEGRWICLDFGDVVVHLFLDEVRHYFDLERLWGDAPARRFEMAPAATG
jgi:ribosome-associated protein